jgi:hypothetical protein
MFRWAIKGNLARGRRPGVELKRGGQVQKAVVDAWIKEAQKSFGIRSIICLLDERQLKYYERLPADLISYYRSQGFEVVHIPAPNMRKPPLSDQHLKKVWKAFQHLPKPILIHCSAGIGRTGHAARVVTEKLKASQKVRARMSANRNAHY